MISNASTIVVACADEGGATGGPSLSGVGPAVLVVGPLIPPTA